MTTRYFKVAVTKNEKERGIGIEEIKWDERSRILYIASLYVEGLSRQETFDYYVKHILSLLNDGETARIQVLDYAFNRGRGWEGKYQHLKVFPYKRGQGKFKTVIMLATDAIEKKRDITEQLEEIK